MTGTWQAKETSQALFLNAKGERRHPNELGWVLSKGGKAIWPEFTPYAMRRWCATTRSIANLSAPAGIRVLGALVILLRGIGHLARRREELLGLAANLVTLFVIAPLRCILDSILALSLRPIRERWLLLVLPLRAGALSIAAG